MKIGDIITDGKRTLKCIGEASGLPVCQVISAEEVKEVKEEAPKRRRKVTE